MVLNQCSTTILAPTTVCHQCSGEERWLLHSVRHEGTLLRLCTSCVLRLHPHSFCPTCFTLYPPSPNQGIKCSRCNSVSHSSCVSINPKNPYVCPLCISPKSPIFLISRGRGYNGVGCGGGGGNVSVGVNGEKGIFIDRNDARILEVASTISCFSMSKAALDKKYEAEWRAMEAVNTRKRAKQALEHMAVVVAKEKMRRNEGSGVEFAMPRGNVGGVMERRRDSNGNSIGNGGGGALAGARSLEKKPVVGNMERLGGSSNGVLVGEINGVECMEKGSLGGIRPSFSNGASIDVHEHKDVSLSSSLDVGDSGVQSHDVGIVCEMSSNPDQLNQSAPRNPVTSNGVVLPPPKEDQFQGVKSEHPEQNNNDLKH